MRLPDRVRPSQNGHADMSTADTGDVAEIREWAKKWWDIRFGWMLRLLVPAAIVFGFWLVSKSIDAGTESIARVIAERK